MNLSVLNTESIELCNLKIGDALDLIFIQAEVFVISLLNAAYIQIYNVGMFALLNPLTRLHEFEGVAKLCST